jgi:hypothetical protein
LQNEALREKLGRRARLVAQTNHDAAKVRTAFWDTLYTAAKDVRHGTKHEE